VKNTEIKRKRE